MTRPNASPTAPRDDAAPVPEATAPDAALTHIRQRDPCCDECDAHGYDQVGDFAPRYTDQFTVPTDLWQRYTAAKREYERVRSDLWHIAYAAQQRREAARKEELRVARLNELRALGYTIVEPSDAPAADAAGRAG